MTPNSVSKRQAIRRVETLNHNAQGFPCGKSHGFSACPREDPLEEG